MNEIFEWVNTHLDTEVNIRFDTDHVVICLREHAFDGAHGIKQSVSTDELSFVGIIFILDMLYDELIKQHKQTIFMEEECD